METKQIFTLRIFLPLFSASCDYWRWGSGGRQESINAICILALNIINDKVSSSEAETIVIRSILLSSQKLLKTD